MARSSNVRKTNTNPGYEDEKDKQQQRKKDIGDDKALISDDEGVRQTLLSRRSNTSKQSHYLPQDANALGCWICWGFLPLG